MHKQRCEWCLENDLYINYHDLEWGVPVFDDKKWFEFLVLEGAQAGLSWLTILKRRQNYRAAFADFNVEKVASFGDADVARLMNNPGIIRNGSKIKSAINNAGKFIEVQEKKGSFSNFMWEFVEGKPIQNHWSSLNQIPAKTDLSEKISKEMRGRGFTFFGPTIAYAHMQATGIVNDHISSCFRYKEVQV